MHRNKKRRKWSRGTIWENRDNIHGIAVSLNWKKKSISRVAY